MTRITRTKRRSTNKAGHTLIHSRPSLRRLPPLAHDSSGAVAQFYFGADMFGSFQQFFFDGNKRTSRMMMNGILMNEGIDAISVPAARAHEFNSKMVGFFRLKNGDEMMAFMVSCHPEWAPNARPGVVSALQGQSTSDPKPPGASI